MNDELVSGRELLEACKTYMELVNGLPPELVKAVKVPSFSRFISPANTIMLEPHGIINPGSWYMPSITGWQRLALLKSPHCKTLFRAYVVNHCMPRKGAEKNDKEEA